MEVPSSHHCTSFLTMSSSKLLHSSDICKPVYYMSSKIAWQPLDTKWLEGSGNIVKVMVAELKKLLNMELHNSVEFSQSLTEAVFPITIFLFQLARVFLTDLEPSIGRSDAVQRVF